MTLQARKSSRKTDATRDAPPIADRTREVAELSRLAATEPVATVATTIARYLHEALGSDSILVLGYGSTPGRLTVSSAHGAYEIQPGTRIPASPLLTPASGAEVAPLIDSSMRSSLPGNEKPRAAISAAIPGPYSATGAVAALFSKPRDFPDSDVSLVEMAASLLGAAQQKEAASRELADSLGVHPDRASTGRTREHAVLAGMARAAAESPDLETALASICEWTAELVPYDHMVIGLVDDKTSAFTRSVVHGDDAQGMPAGERHLLTADELEMLARASSGVAEPPSSDEAVGSSIRVPIASDGRLIGVVWLGSGSANSYSDESVAVMSRVAEYISPIVDSAIERERTRTRAREAGESSQQLAAVLAAAPVALVAIDASGMCTLVEGRLVRDMGAISNLIKGHSLFELTGRHPQVEDTVRAALRGVPGSAVLKVGRRYLELSIQPVLATDGGIDGAIIVGTDVTERTTGRAALAEVKQLQMAQEERARMMSAVSHELRTPLTSIVAFIDILALNQPGNLTAEQAQALSVVQKSAERLDRLIGDLHDLSRMEAGMFTLDAKTVDVNGLMQYLSDTYEPLLKSKRQSLVVDNRAEDWQVDADEVRVSQAVSNLLSNASKYSPADSEVTLCATVVDGSLELLVRDNGPGIPEELRDRVFDAFFRVDNEYTKSAPGSGLGLAIVKRIVDLHDGAVDITNGAEGGTTVSIRIPGARQAG